jgi:phage gpG-like protein
MQLRFDVTGQLNVKQRVELLKMPPAKRKRLSGQLARKIRVNTRRRLREQKDIKGRSWAARKGKNRRKMMRGLSKRLTAKGTSQAGTVSFDNALVGSIARAQQEGVTEVMTAAKMQKIHGEPDYDGPATRAQAKALRAEGYKIRKKSGKGYKNATVKGITETLTLGQAGIILRMMRDKEHKTSWVIPLPARPFLGASEKEIKDMVQTVFNKTINAKARG